MRSGVPRHLPGTRNVQPTGPGWWAVLWLLVALCGCSQKAPPTPSATSATPTAPSVATENSAPPASDTSPATAETLPIQATLKPYTVSPTFEGVAYYPAMRKAVALDTAAATLLARNLFVCLPTTNKQLFYTYENNEYLKLPNFVTTDSVLQLYHVFYDFTLRTVEADALAPVLKRLTEGMLTASVATWKEVRDPKLKQAALKNVAYFGVAARALGLKPELPAAAVPMVDRETALIAAHAGYDVGAIFPYKIDYSQFIPRGHYTRSEALKRFFGAMMWYGVAPFAPHYQAGGSVVRADEVIQQSLLLVRTLTRAGLAEAWVTLYEPTAFYAGTADDLTPFEWQKVSDQVYGKEASLEVFAADAKLEPFVTAIGKARPPRIQSRVVIEERVPAPDAQLRFMGQRYLPDSEILQRLTMPGNSRPFPCGLDVMAVLGSARAATLLDSFPQIFNEYRWAEYVPERTKLRDEFARLKPETWTANLYWSWLHTLRALTAPVPAGYPSFMRNDAWADKSLHTALGSWAELRHDTILYGKNSGAECGDGEEPPVVKGYVEPNVLCYDRLLTLTRQSREGLTRRKLLSDRLKDRFEQFEDLLTFLKKVSEKELRDEKRTPEEYEEIRVIGGKFEYLTLSVMSGNPDQWELVSETDRDMAVVADVHAALDQRGASTPGGGSKALEEAVGHAYEMLVIVPIDGKLTLTRGAVFSYYEFKHPLEDRLTDEKWQAILKAGRAPDPPVWTRRFLAPGKPRRLKPGELEVYSSGC